jgi:peptidoglycan DL-endopeptidase CwlO
MRVVAKWERPQVRRVAAGTCALAAGLLVVLGPVAASAGPAGLPVTGTTTTTAGVATMQAQAASIALMLHTEGLRLDQLAEQFDRATLNAGRVAAQMAEAKARMAATDGQLRAAQQAVLRQAIADYVLGGQTAYLALSGAGTGGGFDEIGRRHAYALSVASAKQDALRVLRRLRHQMDQGRSLLAKLQRAADADLARITADRQAASAAATAEQATLNRVKGDLAALVAAQQAQLASQQSGRVLAALAARRVGLPATMAGPNSTLPFTTVPTTRGPRPTSPPTTSPGRTTTTTTPPPPPPGNQPARGWQTAVAAAQAELGKPYQWGAAGPDSFDCSGLTMWSWGKAGVGLFHLAQDQYAATRRIAIADLLPGDLVFYGTPSNVHHVGIYVGNGTMIDAPDTGEFVHYTTIYFDGLLAGGRIID